MTSWGKISFDTGIMTFEKEDLSMDILKFEARKMFRYRRGPVYVFLFLVSELFLLSAGAPANPEMYAHKDDCIWYLNQIGGQLTEEHQKFLEEEAAAMSQADSAVQTAYKQYFDGLISQDTLEENVESPFATLERKAGFHVIYEQYLYARQDPAHRYLLNTNGWEALLSRGGLDLPLILVLFLLLAPIYCDEGKSQMDTLSLTMKKGGTFLSRYKILYSVLVVLALNVSGMAAELLFVSEKYGLPNGNFPLQSLSCYGTSTKELSLWSAYFLTIALETAGSLCLDVFILFGTALTKKYAPVLLGCMAAVFLPVYGFSQTIRYTLPGPAGFLTPSGFLRGDQTAVDSLTGESVTVFGEISLSGLLLRLALTAALCLFMIAAVQRKNSGKWKHHSFRTISKLSALCAAVFLTAGLFGCAGPASREISDTIHDNGKASERISYCLSDAGHYETDDYRIEAKEDENLELHLTAEDKHTGRQFPLVRDVFEDSYEVMPCIYGNGNYVYYIKMTVDKSETILYSMYEHLLVQEVNLKDFSERTILKLRMNEKNLLGAIFQTKSADWSYYLALLGFFLDKDYVYFISSGDISRVSYLTGKREVLIEAPLLSSVAYDGQNIYYLNERFRLVKFSLSEQESQVMSDKIMQQFTLPPAVSTQAESKNIESINASAANLLLHHAHA